jgi:multicomponent Na+:H+ antiporter subunit D
MTAALPILIPFSAALVLLFLATLGRTRSIKTQRWVSLGASAALLGASLYLLAGTLGGEIFVLELGGWQAPFGIVLVVDRLAAIMLTLAALLGTLIALYSLGTIDRRREAFYYHPLFQVLLMGVCGSFTTGDIFNLFVWFEVMLIASFVLLALGGERPQIEGALKYVTLNLISSAMFLSAIGLLYGAAGSLNFADLSVRLADTDQPWLKATLAMLFLTSFGIKSAIFPLFFWLPGSYATPPAPVTAIFAGILTKVGVYAILRTVSLLFVGAEEVVLPTLIVLSIPTMVVGVFGAVSQNEFRRILAFHSISQIGYITLGVGLFTPLGIAGSLVFMIHHSLVKTGLFLVSGIVNKLRGTYQLKPLGGLYPAHMSLSILFFVLAMGLAGMPPSSGFVAKLAVIRAALEPGTVLAYVGAGAALFTGIYTMYSMTKIWGEAFWKSKPEDGAEDKVLSQGDKVSTYVPLASLAALMLFVGLAAGTVMDISFAAADQVLDTDAYIDAVLGGDR